MERMQRAGLFVGLAVVVVLAIVLTAWHGSAQTAKPSPVTGGVGRFQIVVAQQLPELDNNGQEFTTRTYAFLVDSQTGRIWERRDSLYGGQHTWGWQEMGVDGISTDRIPLSIPIHNSAN